MHKSPIPRLDQRADLHDALLAYCRLAPGEIWKDPVNGHKVGCIDATNDSDLQKLYGKDKSSLFIQDPPYNLVIFETKSVDEYIAWSRKWVGNQLLHAKEDVALYTWLGAHQDEGFQPLPEFMLMMREFPVKSRSFITMRNQRGYGTQYNWMAVRQELLYYAKGEPTFHVQYTDIPKILKGYYKEVGGKVTENTERSKSEFIRPGNVWVDIQQVFYRMDENVNGCYAQKPLKCIDRIVKASSDKGDLVSDFFAHAGTTLIASEMNDRKCYTTEIDPVFAEITIRRLEHYRKTGEPGWQNGNPFEAEIAKDKKLQLLVSSEEPVNEAVETVKSKKNGSAQATLFT